MVLQSSISNAASISYDDTWDLLYGTTSDAVVWGDFNLWVYAGDIDTEADCLCWDWDDDGSDDDIIANWDHCYCESSQKQSDCESYSSLVYTVCVTNGDCASGVSLTDSHFTDTGNDGDHWREYRDIREYRDCDDSASEQGIYNWEGQEGEPYWVVYRHQFDCDSTPGPSTDPDYEGDYDSWVNIDANTGMCSASEDCDEDHDQDISTTYNEVLDSPCRTKDGYSCTDPDDCISNTCDGDHWGYLYDCDTDGDGATDFDRYDKNYDDACGGTGIYVPAGDQDNHLSCTSIYGSGYVCDAYDPQADTEYTSTQQICNKQLGESCSADSDCWHYDKPADTTSCDYGGSGSKHCIYSCYEDSACTGSYNDCKTTDCGTANQDCYYCVCTNDVGGPDECDSCLDLANGNSCDCNEECQSNYCDEEDECATPPSTETDCTDTVDNDVDGSTDCDDSDCEGETGPNGKICCNDGAYSCGTCKECNNDECENQDVGEVCDSNYFCSNTGGGDNGYNASDFKVPSQGLCDASQNCDYSSSSPLCTYAEGTTQEGTGSTICQDAFSSCRDTCADSLDNDANGCTDGDDYQCGGTESNCENSQDDDCDGDVDDADSDCTVADLEILEVIPIQVVPDVDMVKGKSGFVKVIAVNNGPDSANGTVSVLFNGQPLTADGSARKPINVNQNVSFYFTFKPATAGTNLVINASIEVS